MTLIFKRALFSLLLTSLATAYATTYIFSYVGFLVKDFGHLQSNNEAGKLAGYLSGAMFFGRSFSAPFWGYLSDRFGRRPTLIASSIACIIFPLLFGFSTNLKFVFLARFLLGFFNGTTPIVRAVVPEIATDETMPMAYSMLSSVWSFGRILGPALSGWTVQTNEAILVENTTFKHTESITYHKYLTPSLITTTIGVLGFLALLLLLPETHPDKIKREDILESEAFLTTKDNKKEIIHKEKMTDVLLTRRFLSSMTLYSLYSFSVTFLTDVFPLWAISSEDKGGLNLNASQVGTIFAIGGIAMLFSSSGVYLSLKLQIKIKTLAAVLLGFYSLFIWLTPRFPLYVTPLNPFWGLIFINCLREFIEVIIFNNIFVCLNNSVSPDHKGIANGVAIGVASITKMLGPVLGAPLFAWTITDHEFLSALKFTFAFDINTFVVFTCVVFTIFVVPDSINNEFSKD